MSSGEVVRNQQSTRLLEELLALSLDEQWRLMMDRDLRLRRLTDDDFALFCRHLGIRPPPGVLDYNPTWRLPARVEPRWPVESEDPAEIRRRRLGRNAKIAAAALLVALGLTQAFVIYRLRTRDQTAEQIADLKETTDNLGAAVLESTEGVNTGAKLAAQAVGDLERLRLAMAQEQLRSALEAGRPFASALTVVAASPKVPDSLRADLAILQPFGSAGVRTLAMLREQFESARQLATVVDMDMSPAAGLCREIGTFFLLNLCQLNERNQRAELLRQAERAVSRGDLTGAIALLSRLSRSAAGAVEPWVTAAKLRLTADQAINQLAAGIFVP